MIVDPEMTKTTFHWTKLRLFERMKYRGLIDRKVCQQLCYLFEHDGFFKQRKENHAGIMRLQELCIKCKCPGRIDLTKIRREMESGEPWAKRQKPFRADPTPQKLFHATNEANIALTVC